jgi:hypothetical protein
MTRLILGILLTLAIGCTSIRPVGPLAKMGPPPGAKDKGSKDKDADAEPVMVPAVKPTPPMNLVDPSDVTADPYSSAQRLQNEIEGDRKTIPAPTNTAEVSYIKGGVKQN